MSDEALNAHLDWLDKALEQNMDYETWLEGRVALLEAENEALSELLSPLVDVELERDVAMSENQRLTKHVEDYEAENATLRQAVQAAIDYFTDGITSKEQYDAYLKFVDAAQPFFEEHEVEP